MYAIPKWPAITNAVSALEVQTGREGTEKSISFSPRFRSHSMSRQTGERKTSLWFKYSLRQDQQEKDDSRSQSEAPFFLFVSSSTFPSRLFIRHRNKSPSLSFFLPSGLICPLTCSLFRPSVRMKITVRSGRILILYAPLFLTLTPGRILSLESDQHSHNVWTFPASEFTGDSFQFHDTRNRTFSGKSYSLRLNISIRTASLVQSALWFRISWTPV